MVVRVVAWIHHSIIRLLDLYVTIPCKLINISELGMREGWMKAGVQVYVFVTTVGSEVLKFAKFGRVSLV